MDAVTARLAPLPMAVAAASFDLSSDDESAEGWTLAPPPPSAQAQAQRAAFKATLTALLNDAGVRAACGDALAADPSFRALVDAAAGPGASVELDSLLPPAAAAAMGAPDTGDPLGDVAAAVADALAAVAARVARHAAAAGELVGDAFQALVRAVLRVGGRQGRQGQGRARRPRAPAAAARDWGDLLTIVAMAAVAVLAVVRGLPPPRRGVA